MLFRSTTMQVAAQAGDHFRLVGRLARAQGVGLDVLVEQYVRVQFRALAGQTDQTQPLCVFLDELLGRRRAMHRVAIDGQVKLAPDLSERAPHELEEHRVLELPLEHHEGQLAAIGDRRDHVAAKALALCPHQGRAPIGAKQVPLTGSLRSPISDRKSTRLNSSH